MTHSNWITFETGDDRHVPKSWISAVKFNDGCVIEHDGELGSPANYRFRKPEGRHIEHAHSKMVDNYVYRYGESHWTSCLGEFIDAMWGNDEIAEYQVWDEYAGLVSAVEGCCDVVRLPYSGKYICTLESNLSFALAFIDGQTVYSFKEKVDVTNMQQVFIKPSAGLSFDQPTPQAGEVWCLYGCGESIVCIDVYDSGGKHKVAVFMSISYPGYGMFEIPVSKEGLHNIAQFEAHSMSDTEYDSNQRSLDEIMERLS